MTTITPLLRHSAVKSTIIELLEGTWVHAEEVQTPYLLTPNQRKIYRLNLLATIVHKEQLGTITTFLLDDGTGRMYVRCFEEFKMAPNLQVGDALLMIGKVREYNNEKYLSPEILKKINPGWLKVRREELKEKYKEPIVELENKIGFESIIKEDDVVEFNGNLPAEKIKQLIKNLDFGEGVLIEEILEQSSLHDTEATLQKMLEKGDIFQVSPGKVKIL